MGVIIRLAYQSDADAIIRLRGSDKREQVGDILRSSIAAGDCFAAWLDGHIVGYITLEYSFYHNGFISMLFVGREHRRTGVGEKLMRHAESVCLTPKLFTSTNLSNLPMQALLAKLGYLLSGVIENLDEGDPELVYMKRVQH